MKSLGRKVRRLISRCDVCHMVKHPNRRFETESRIRIPKTAGELCMVDLYGPLPTGRGGVCYIFVCLDVFTKFVKLYALRAATARACLQKITKHYVADVIRPKCILSDNGTQFTSPVWKRQLADLAIEGKFCPVRRPQANPSERFIEEIGKFFKICCFQSHRRWPELLPKVDEWLNHTMADSAGFCPVELMFELLPDLFKKFLKKDANQLPQDESLLDKVLRAYLRMKLKTGGKKKCQKRGQHEWKPQGGDLVLSRCQPVSEAAKGVTSKFTRPYEGP